MAHGERLFKDDVDVTRGQENELELLPQDPEPDSIIQRIRNVDNDEDNSRYLGSNSDSSSSRTTGHNHSMSTVGLCMCTLTVACLQLSIFPYAGYMAIHLINSNSSSTTKEKINEENAGIYAGVLASSFLVGRTVSSYAWGRLADTYGRIFVLNASLALCCIFSVLFGTSSTFGYALFWRFCSGLGSGIMATTKTAATELAFGDEQLERRAMGLVIGTMRGWGFLLSPAIGGWLAEPLSVKQPYSSASASTSSVAWWLNLDASLPNWIPVTDVLTQYPFLLANLVGAVLCLLTALAVNCFLVETLPTSKRRDPKFLLVDFYHHIVLASFHNMRRGVRRCWDTLWARRTNVPPKEGESLPLLQTASRICNGNDGEAFTPVAHLPPLTNSRKARSSSVSSSFAIWSSPNTRRHLETNWMFAFLVSTANEAFPLFCMSHRAGFGLSSASIGDVLSSAGIVFLCFQYTVYSFLFTRFGIYSSMTICAMGAIPMLIVLPLSVLLNQYGGNGSDTSSSSSNASNSSGAVDNNEETISRLTRSAFLFLSITWGTSKILISVLFAGFTISLNKTVPTVLRATMNGLNSMGFSAAGGLGPIFAGVLVTYSVSSDSIVPSQWGGFVIWTSISLLGLVVAVRNMRNLERELGDTDKT